jgi:hypothetical protein
MYTNICDSSPIHLTHSCFNRIYSKQRGWDARQADNLFYHLTYYDTEDLARIEDEGLRTETELHIADFGHCPSQLFVKAHPKKKTESLKSKSKVSHQFP